MGSFYTNIHLLTTNSELVERAWTGYWDGRDERSWCLISPQYNGWLTVFDWRGDQVDTDILTDMASHLSRVADCVGLAFQVQDSELAEYWLFNQGVEVDHYTSNAEYYAAYAQPPVTNAEEEGIFVGYGPDSEPGYTTHEDLTDGGNTDLLRSLTRTAVNDMELEAILRTPSAVADDILTALASAIGINDTWASVGYHYLVTEGDTIPGIDEFRRVPQNEPLNPTRFPEKAS
ncbi:MAG: hypothetical protein ACYC6A_22405 [Armatimonadota bacterium]